MEVQWTQEHQRVEDLFRAGRSVFVTGSAGSGKVCLKMPVHVATSRPSVPVGLQTFLLRHLLGMTAGDKGVHCTALTGMAAQALPEGTTLHKFAGVGLAQGEAKVLVQTMKYPVQARWRSARILVIDEVSMLDADLFEKFDQVCSCVLRWG